MKLSSDYPLVSVIILCYNQAEIVGRAISSLLNQTYPNVQLVIVDDGSTDASKKIIEEWQARYPKKIKTFFQPSNVGHPANMNTGYRLCDGELVTFCDGDDWYFPEKIEREVAFLKQHPEIDVVYSNFDFYSVEGTFIKHWATKETAIPAGDIFLPLFSLAYPFQVHFRYEMTSKKIIEETGLYDESIPIWVDWDFRLRLAARYKFGYCHYIGSAYTQNPQGLTQVIKQEIILANLKLVVEKNRHNLMNYPAKDRNRVVKKINLSIQKMELSIALHKGQSSFWKTLRFLYNYPYQLSDFRFVLASLFGKGVFASLSRVKQKTKKLFFR